MEKNEGLFNVYFKADRVDYGKNGYESINLKNNPNLMSDSIYLYNLLFMNKPAFVPRDWEQHQVNFERYAGFKKIKLNPIYRPELYSFQVDRSFSQQRLLNKAKKITDFYIDIALDLKKVLPKELQKKNQRIRKAKLKYH